MPQLREACLNGLPHLRKQELASGRIPARDEQCFGLLLKQGSRGLATIAQVSEQDSAIAGLAQREQRRAVIEAGGRQHDIEKTPGDGAQSMQFEAEEPALTCLPEACAVLSHQAHTPMSQRVTQWYRLGIDQIQGRGLFARAGGLQQQADVDGELMQAPQPFCVRRQARESALEVIGYQTIGLLEGGDLKRALHQRDGQNFRVGKARRMVGRTPPPGAVRMSFQVVVNKAVDFGHLMLYALGHRSPSFGRRSCFATPFYRPLKDWRPSLFNS